MAYQLKTMKIKGKDYVLVNERIIAFRKLPEYQGFSIETELLHLDEASCVVRATIRNSEGKIVAQGMAQEDRTSSMINKTSYVENCETSAVGRCQCSDAVHLATRFHIDDHTAGDCGAEILIGFARPGETDVGRIRAGFQCQT